MLDHLSDIKYTTYSTTAYMEAIYPITHEQAGDLKFVQKKDLTLKDRVDEVVLFEVEKPH